MRRAPSLRRPNMVLSRRAYGDAQSPIDPKTRGFVTVAVLTPGLGACVLGAIILAIGVTWQRPEPDRESNTEFPSRSLKAARGLVLAVNIATPSRTVAISSTDSTVKLWDPPTGALRSIPLETPARSMSYSPDGTLLAITVVDTDIYVYDIRTTSEEPKYILHSDKIVRVTAFNPRGDTLAAGNFDGSVTLWDLNTFKPRTTFGEGAVSPQIERLQSPYLTAMTYSPDGKTLVTGQGNGMVHVWNPSTGRLLREWQASKTPIDALAIPIQGDVLATAAILDTDVRLWDLETGHTRVVLEDGAKGIKTLAFDLQGSTLATAGGDEMIKIWDRRKGTPLRTLRGHEAKVWCLSYSRDGRWLVSGDAEGGVRLWPTDEFAAGPKLASGDSASWN